MLRGFVPVMILGKANLPNRYLFQIIHYVPGITFRTGIKWEAKQSPGPRGVNSLARTLHSGTALETGPGSSESGNLPDCQEELPYRMGVITVNLIMFKD